MKLKRGPSPGGSEAGGSSLLGRTLESLDVELAHFHHCRHDSFGLLRIFQQLVQHGRDDLPGKAELVLEPAARSRLAAAFRELRPQLVDLFLRLAIHDERNGFAELE